MTLDVDECANCGALDNLHVTLDLFPDGREMLCNDCVPRDPECSCGGTGGDHDIDCVRFPF